MKLNNKQIIIPLYIKESLNDDTIIYNEDNKKVIVLNSTATSIWEIINKSYQNGININTNDILSELIKKYNTNEICKDDILNDIENTICLLFESSLLKTK